MDALTIHIVIPGRNDSVYDSNDEIALLADQCLINATVISTQRYRAMPGTALIR
jgi:hypothetical protein